MLDKKDIEKLSEAFLIKEEFKEEINKLATKDELIEFKNEILTGQDKILEKLETFSQEKTMDEEQDKRKKRAFEIHNNALKRGNILSAEEIVEISKLNVAN
jgi:hypothetical protein